MSGLLALLAALPLVASLACSRESENDDAVDGESTASCEPFVSETRQVPKGEFSEAQMENGEIALAVCEAFCDSPDVSQDAYVAGCVVPHPMRRTAGEKGSGPGESQSDHPPPHRRSTYLSCLWHVDCLF